MLERTRLKPVHPASASDIEQLELFFINYRSTLERYAHSLTNSRAAAEDILGSLFLRFRELAESGGIKSYEERCLNIQFRTAIKRRAIDYWRDQQRYTLLNHRQAAHQQLSADQAAIRQEQAAKLRAALARLPDHYQAAIRLIELEELTVEEVAHQHHCQPQTVRNWLYRGLNRLYLLLVNEFGDEHSPAKRPALCRRR